MTTEDTRSSGSEPFPAVPRVRYRKSTLVEVVCQVRFPAVLRIESEVPVAFQESVRDEFPVTEVARNNKVTLPAGGGAVTDSHALYRFKTEDGAWNLNLQSSSISLTTTQYDSWENFAARFKCGWDALLSIYSPKVVKRVGLRYINFIRRHELGLEHTSWSELLQPHIVGELALEEVAAHVTDCHKVVTFRLTDKSGIKLQHGIAEMEGEEQRGYAIDFDFSLGAGARLENVFAELARFNLRSRGALRWCITELLHEAMGPVPAGNPALIGG